jgi:hypothetical protein
MVGSRDPGFLKRVFREVEVAEDTDQRGQRRAVVFDKRIGERAFF